MQLIDFIDELEDVAAHIGAERGIALSYRDITRALILQEEGLREIAYSGDVWDFETDIEHIKEVARTFDFSWLGLEIEHETAIPYPYRRYTKARVRNNGEVWVVHANDADPFPSNPHAHNFDQGIKLDLRNGHCYRSRKLLFTIQRRELLDIREKFEAKGIVMPLLAF